MMKKACKILGLLLCCSFTVAVAEPSPVRPGNWQQGIIYNFNLKKPQEILAIPVLKLHEPNLIATATDKNPWQTDPDVVSILQWSPNTKTIRLAPLACPPGKKRELPGRSRIVNYHNYGFVLPGYGYSANGNLPYLAWSNQVMFLTPSQPPQAWRIKSDKQGFTLMACSLLANGKKQVLVQYEYHDPQQGTGAIAQIALLDLNTMTVTDLPNISKHGAIKAPGITFALWLTDNTAVLCDPFYPGDQWTIADTAADTIVTTQWSQKRKPDPFPPCITTYFVSDGVLWGVDTQQSLVIRLFAAKKENT